MPEAVLPVEVRRPADACALDYDISPGKGITGLFVKNAAHDGTRGGKCGLHNQKTYNSRRTNIPDEMVEIADMHSSPFEIRSIRFESGWLLFVRISDGPDCVLAILEYVM
jgi:hypothetical protein